MEFENAAICAEITQLLIKETKGNVSKQLGLLQIISNTILLLSSEAVIKQIIE